MKLLCLLFFLIIVADPCSSQNTFFEPGAIWKDTEGKHINAHGGGIYSEGDTYYWYGEHKGQSSIAQVGVRVYSSSDLYNWKNEGIALAVSNDLDSEITKGSVIERPKVIYNNKTGKYVMWFHLELKNQGYAAARTGVAISDSPTGPFKYLKSYRPNANVWPLNFPLSNQKRTKKNELYEWWTPEWKAALIEGLYVRRDFREGQMSRDMTVFVDDDGKAYHIHSSEENQTLHISELTDDYLDFTSRWTRMKPGGQNEAPAVFKHNDTYYMITSGLTGWAPNAARSFSAKSIWGPWKSLGNPATGKLAQVTFNSQSTYVLTVNGVEDTFLYMGDRWNPKNHIDGRYIWLPIKIKNKKPEIEWLDKWDLSKYNSIQP
ncbi:glycoside hydrolase family 43 protein [Leeuwenhoekiella sp. LLG6367-2.1]|uniref:glycoside hydrolase family 43 protein n=1 Tax=Leeuwenhoekiella sp. LLG6367-2.1 TaxID=3160833 RepID=UPI003869E0E3